MSKRAALFLDRDGVINVDYAYVIRREDFEFVDGIFDLCRNAVRLGYFLVVVTNQAGIGRGYYSEAQFLELTDWMRSRFSAEGIEIGAVYYCPFHPEHGIGDYKIDADCRKPKPGMLHQAMLEHDIEPRYSILIGDNQSDIDAGRAAGVACNILYSPRQKNGNGANRRTDETNVAYLTDAIRYLEALIPTRMNDF